MVCQRNGGCDFEIDPDSLIPDRKRCILQVVVGPETGHQSVCVCVCVVVEREGEGKYTKLYSGTCFLV